MGFISQTCCLQMLPRVLLWMTHPLLWCQMVFKDCLQVLFSPQCIMSDQDPVMAGVRPGCTEVLSSERDFFFFKHVACYTTVMSYYNSWRGALVSYLCLIPSVLQVNRKRERRLPWSGNKIAFHTKRECAGKQESSRGQGEQRSSSMRQCSMPA